MPNALRALADVIEGKKQRETIEKAIDAKDEGKYICEQQSVMLAKNLRDHMRTGGIIPLIDMDTRTIRYSDGSKRGPVKDV